MFVVQAEEWIVPGRRLDIEAAHRANAFILERQQGFRSGRLLHFAGGPYRYIHESTWTSRADWERFWSGPDFETYRSAVDAHLQSPFVLTLFDVVPVTAI